MKNAQRKVVALVLAVVLAGAYWLRVDPPHGALVDSSAEGIEAATAIHEQGVLTGQWEEGVVSFRQSTFVQEYIVHGGGDFVVVDSAQDVTTGEWLRTSYTTNVTFEPFVFASAGRDYFAVSGIDQSTGDTVIERLKLVSKIATPGSPPTKTFVRAQIYRGNIGQPPVALGIDPDKRFILFLCNVEPSRQLYKIPMQVNATPVLLYDVAAQPVLGQAWILNPLEHVSLGRIWLVSGMTNTFTGETMVLVDSNNDGAFEPPPIVDTHANLVSSGLLEASEVSTPFIED